MTTITTNLHLTLPLHRTLKGLALTCAALVLGGCAAFAPATPEQAVQKRAGNYWKARVSGQVDKAYALSTPSYRKLRTPEQFKMQFGAGASVQSAEITQVTCEAEKCNTQVKLGVVPALAGIKMGTIYTYLDETWVREEGEWWHYQDL